MKITEYPKTKSLNKEDLLLVDGKDGTRTIKVEDSYLAQVEAITEEPWIAHRNIYRGKNLGKAFTDEQLSHIKDGSFKDLYVGDYWENDGKTWLIADINYFNRWKDQSTNHLVIISKDNLYTSPMNSSNTTSGGYMGSEMYSSNLDNAKNMIHAFFGKENLYTYREILSNNAYAQDKGVGANGISVVDSASIELMGQRMVIGYDKFVSSATNSWVYQDKAKNKLSIFNKNPKLVMSNDSYWLRDVADYERFVNINASGEIYKEPSSTSTIGVRPIFAVK